ncbi:MAG: threonine/serine exporter family protein, partial [Ruthenibacterium sp.]
VPGMALTTSIRDFANSDYLSGAIRMIDALLVAGSIAIGVGVALRLLALVPGVLI